MAVTVRAASRPGRASGSRALRTICRVVAPIAWVASMMPRSTSRSAVSARRANSGVAPTTSGGMAPSAPSEVPTISSVSGIIRISRMTKGTERSTLTTRESRRYSGRLSNSWRGPQRNSSTPSGRPSSTVNSSEPPSIARVSRLACQISGQNTLGSSFSSISAVPPHARRRRRGAPGRRPGRRR
ncbi:hypothetical protein D3C81_1464270 [compost metagenome]